MERPKVLSLPNLAEAQMKIFTEIDPMKRKFEEAEPTKIDKSLVQITVSSEELNNRIQSFIDRKREQVNLSNIHDFIPRQGRESETEDTCARVRVVFVKRSDSKCHLKVHRVNNEWGPQTVRERDRAPASAESAGGAELPLGVEERVRDVERFLNIRSVTPDVYRRLKQAEDRIRHLESISPEYAHFWRNSSESNTEAESKKMDCRYTAEEIDRKIEELEKHSADRRSIHSMH